MCNAGQNISCAEEIGRCCWGYLGIRGAKRIRCVGSEMGYFIYQGKDARIISLWCDNL